MKSIYENIVLQHVSEGNNKIRVIWVDNENRYCYFVNIYSNTCMPKLCDVRELEEGISCKELLKVPEPFNYVLSEDDIPNEHRRLRDEAWKIVEYIWYQNRVRVLFKNTRNNVIKDTAEKFKISEKKVIRIISRFWQRGMTRNAVLPDFHKCGGKGKIKLASEAKRGRPRKPDLNGEVVKGINVDENILKIFRSAIALFYKKKDQKTLAETYFNMLKTFFSDKYIVKGKEEYEVWNKDRLPSKREFYYWHKNEQNYVDEFIERNSKKNYELTIRELLGNSTIEAFGPGSRYQIDATIADVYLISIFNRKRIIGRPVVYVVIDVFTRLIVGVNIGIEGPSWVGAMMALDNVVQDKVEFCEKYGINIKVEQWPNSYLPETILADRGEFEGYNVENLINNLNIRIENAPPYRADLKGIVERHFKTMNGKIKHMTPGAIQKQFRERGDRDYRLDAILDINEFASIIIYEIIHHNNSLIKGYPREQGLISDEILSIPVELWKWGLKNRRCAFKIKDRDVIRLNLMCKGEAAIRREGIKLNSKLYYSCQEALQNYWFVNRVGEKIKIVYDPRDTNYIYIPTKNGNEFIKCSLLERCFAYKNVPLEEVIFQNELESELIENNKDNQNRVDVDYVANSEQVIERAKKKKENASSRSASSMIKNIRSSRAEEKEFIREKEKFELENDKSKKTLLLEENDKLNVIESNKPRTGIKLSLLKQVRDQRNAK